MKLRGGLVEAERDGAWLDSEALRLQAELKSGLLRRDRVQDAIMCEQLPMSHVVSALLMDSTTLVCLGPDASQMSGPVTETYVGPVRHTAGLYLVTV